MRSNQTGLLASTEEQDHQRQREEGREDQNLVSTRLTKLRDRSGNNKNSRNKTDEITDNYTVRKNFLQTLLSAASSTLSSSYDAPIKFRTPASLFITKNNSNTSAHLHHNHHIIRNSKNRKNSSNSFTRQNRDSHTSPTTSAGIHHHHPGNRINSKRENSTHIIATTTATGGDKGDRKGYSSSRRIFTPEFKRTVVNAFAHDPECFGNQRATARKFRIHRRQVQKWIQQNSSSSSSSSTCGTANNQVNNSDAASCESQVVAASSTTSTTATTTTTAQPPLKSSSPRSSSSVMANAINTLLSLRDAVRIKAPWSPQGGSSLSSSSGAASNLSAAALNLGLLSNSAAMLHDLDPPQSSTPTGNHSGSKSSGGTPGRTESNNRSPRISPQSSTSMSPSTTRNPNNNHQYSAHSNGVSNNNSSDNNDLLSPAEIIDELSYLYPQEDFTLLRRACMKNEITLTKLSNRLSFHYPSSPSNGGGGTGKEDFVTQQTLQLIKQQNEYVQMLQQSGVSLPVFPGEMAASLNLAGLTDSHSSSKYSTWFHPLAQAAAAAAAAGISLPSSSGGGINGTSSGNGTSGKKGKPASSDHMFLSPKTPALSSAKPKTVAAALAASRHSPNIMGNLGGLGNGKVNNKKPVLPRKRQSRPRSSTITRPSLVMQDDDIDPFSMVETTTTLPSDYGGSGVDLSKGNDGSDTGKVRIKTEPTFLYNEPSQQDEASDLKSNGHNLLNAASLTLENYLRNVMPKNSPHNNNTNASSSESIRSSPAAPSEPTTMSESDKKKQQVLEAFNDDEEVAGDARGVARKFGLNIRVVLKWLREGPSKSLPALPSTLSLQKSNGGIQSIITTVADLPIELTNGDHSSANNNNDNNNISSHANNNNIKKHLPNKRKNTKPNQICDFQDDDLPEDSDTIPLDMVVPIKKRRVSNSNASS